VGAEERKVLPFRTVSRRRKARDKLPPPGNAAIAYSTRWDGDYSHRWQFGPYLDVKHAMGGTHGAVSFWFVSFRSPCARTVRLDVGTARAVKAWISGVAVDNNQRVCLLPGVHVLTLEVAMPDPVPASFAMTPRLRPSDDVREELRQRRELIEQAEEILREAMERCPGSDVARDCRRLLETR
jgi:hypothetical protein